MRQLAVRKVYADDNRDYDDGKPTVIVSVWRGLVSEVYATDGIRVVVRDSDVEGNDDLDLLHKDEEGEEFLESVYG